MADNKSSGGVGFFGLLCVTFVVLRLCGVISWPWLWVLSPIWLPLAVSIIAIGICCVYEVINRE